jgi:hypothetical protein
MKRNIPRELDWVTKRAECSPASIFDTLKLGLESDVAARNKTFGNSPKCRFILTAKESHCVVTVDCANENTGMGFHKSVVFVLTSAGILVKEPEGKELLRATLTLSDDGECRVKVGEQEYELWQFRKQALEDLFFSVV